MLWNKYFFPSFTLLVVVTALHWIASIYGYYWNLAWYDVMMHFLGGAWVALFALWVSRMPFARRIAPLATVWNLVIFTILVGVAWELHEIILGFANPERPDYGIDTTIDMIMDTLGALAVGLMYRKDRPVTGHTS